LLSPEVSVLDKAEAVHHDDSVYNDHEGMSFDFESMSPREKLELMFRCGMHHSHKRCHPDFKHFLTRVQDQELIDLRLTVKLLDRAAREVKELFANGGNALFVATKPQIAGVVESEARRSMQYWVTKKWIGGMLTNSKYAVTETLKRMVDLESASRDPSYTKKERNMSARKYQQRFVYMEGVTGNVAGDADAKALDKANIKLIVIVDPSKELTAVREVLALRQRSSKNPPVLVIMGDGYGSGFSTKMLGKKDIFIPMNDDKPTSVEFACAVITSAIRDGLDIDSTKRADRNSVKEELINSVNETPARPAPAA
jgi:small subunit ribosomal protein S2